MSRLRPAGTQDTQVRIDVLTTLQRAGRRIPPLSTIAARAVASARARYGWAVVPLVIACSVRLGLFVVAGIAARLVAPATYPGALSIWNRWDAVWYVGIAQHGYYYSPVDQSSANFFPLLPALMWLLGQPLALVDPAQPYLLAGMLISWLSFAGAAIALYRLALDYFDGSTAYGAVLLLAVFPFGYFFGAPYTESLFLLLVLLTFLAIERHWWWLGAVAALLASATRSPGLLLLPCLALAFALDWRERARRFDWRAVRDALSLVVPPLGTLAYMAYSWWLFDAPLAYVTTSEAGWRRGHLRLDGVVQGLQLLMLPWTWLDSGELKPVLFGIYALLTAVFLWSLPAVWRLLGPVYAFYAGASILVPILTTDQMVSEGRYLSVVFPSFIVCAAALRDRPRAREALIAASAAALALFTVLYVLNFEVY
jgi:hypothetical protein